MKRPIFTLVFCFGLFLHCFSQCWNQISVGVFHTGAIQNDGTLWMWGENSDGQLGTGDYRSSLVPVQVGSEDTWKQISVGNDFTIAIKQDGSLWSWGDNFFGQLGNGSVLTTNRPTQIGVHKTWTKVSSGASHNLALASDGTIWAWGYNHFGQLALPIGQFGVGFKAELTQVGTSKNWVDVFAAGSRSFAMQSDNTLWGWGENEKGQLGIGPINQNTYYRSYPSKVLNQQKWMRISAGEYHTAGIDSIGQLWFWGSNEFGQFGNGNFQQKNIPTLLNDSSTWLQVDCGTFYTLAIRSDSTLWACGRNQEGQLGLGSTDNSSVLKMIVPEKGWQEITAGNKSGFALNKKFELSTWGDNSFGNLGSGDLEGKLQPSILTCSSSGVSNFINKIKIQINPNPATSHVTLQVFGIIEPESEFHVFSSSGLIVKSGTMNSNVTTIDVNALPPDTYHVIVMTKKIVCKASFIKL